MKIRDRPQITQIAQIKCKKHHHEGHEVHEEKQAENIIPDPVDLNDLYDPVNKQFSNQNR